MGGAPPLPLNFAPQGVKNWPFLAFFGPRGSGAPRHPEAAWEGSAWEGQRGVTVAGYATENPVRKRGVPEEEAPTGTNSGDTTGRSIRTVRASALRVPQVRRLDYRAPLTCMQEVGNCVTTQRLTRIVR